MRLDKNKNDEITIKIFPFASKFSKDGKLYREKFGKVFTLNDSETNGGITIVEFENPFPVARINKAEFKWFPEEITADFFILDNSNGDYQLSQGVPEGSQVPNAPLTQHGHEVGIAKDNDEDVSEYDAKLIQGMKLRVILTNPTIVSKKCCVNVVFHNEVNS